MLIEKKEIVINADVIEHWQDFLNIIAIRLDIPAALIMKVDLPDIKVFLANKSDANPYKVGESACLFDSGLYCERVYRTKEKLLIPNALKDKEWGKNPDIKLGMISYMGFPILWPDGEVFGTTCVLDIKENAHSIEHESIILQFKEYVEAYLDLALSRYLKKGDKEIKEKDMRCGNIFSKFEKMVYDK